MKKLFTLLAVVILTLTSYGQIPTYGLSLWLDATDNTTLFADTLATVLVDSGGRVALWQDKSAAGNHVIQTDSDLLPIYSMHPDLQKMTVNFDETGQFFRFDRLDSIRAVFMVIKNDGSINNTPILGDSQFYDFHGGANGLMFHSGNASSHILNGVTFLSGFQKDPALIMRPNYFNIISILTTDTVRANQLSKDRGNANRTWLGSIAEVIVYSVELTNGQRGSIETYLTNKYAYRDLSVTTISNPNQSCNMGQDSVVATIVNSGFYGTSNYKINLNINNTLIQSENAPSGLFEPNSEYEFKFPFLYDFSPAEEYFIEVYTTGLTDERSYNDTMSKFIISKIDAFPFLETFEDDFHGWTSGGTKSSWELGLPADNIINGLVSDGLNAWATNLDGDYNDGEYSYVLSPCFNLTNANNLGVGMDLATNIEDFDGAVLEYSTDNGATWQTFGQQGLGYNWYNRNDIFALNYWNNNYEGWTGSVYNNNGDGEWKPVKYPLDDLDGESDVLFRVVMASDFSITDEGLAFDQFQIGDYATVGIEQENKKFEGTIYPNPSTGQLIISCKNGCNQLELFTPLGQQVFTQKLLFSINAINIAHLPKGLYIANIDGQHTRVVLY